MVTAAARTIAVRQNPIRKVHVGAAIVAILLIGAFAGPWIAPYPYDQIDATVRLAPPSAAHWFGTDEFGRDVLSRTLFGARYSVMMGFGATAISLVLGVPLGLIAGFSRGRLGEAILRIMDVLMSFPPIMLGLLILAITTPALWKAMLAVGIVYVPPIVRLTRSLALEIRHEEFVEAARAGGERIPYILFREIWPNALPTIAVEGSLRVTFAILLGASLSFLGLGAQPPSSDWGLMISEARAFVPSAPWIALGPGFAMCLLVIGINLFGDGLRQTLDPKSRLQRIP